MKGTSVRVAVAVTNIKLREPEAIRREQGIYSLRLELWSKQRYDCLLMIRISSVSTKAAIINKKNWGLGTHRRSWQERQIDRKDTIVRQIARMHIPLVVPRSTWRERLSTASKYAVLLFFSRSCPHFRSHRTKNRF